MSIAYVPHQSENHVESDPLVIDHGTREVFLEGERVDLTRVEFDLLSVLHRNPRQVLTPEQLLRQLWGAEFIPDRHPLEVYVHRLRAKLGETGKRPHFIHNVRGVGYRFEPSTIRATCRARLVYDREGTVQQVETSDRTLWGWTHEEIVNTRFIPTQQAMFRNRHFIALVNRLCERAGIRRLTITAQIVTRYGESIPAHAELTCLFGFDGLVGMDVTVTW